MNKIVCFGEALIDFLAEPAQGGGQAQAYLRNAGGAPANVAVAVARLGGAAAFVGMFSQDTFGDFLLESLQDAGVDTRHAARTDLANTALAFVSLNQQGERSFSFYRPPAADLLFRKEHFSDACFAGIHAFHVCSNSMTEPAIAEVTLDGMQRARDAGALVSFDMNLRLPLWRADADPVPYLWQALNAADLVKLSSDELAYLAADAGSESAVLERIWRGNTLLLIVTHGADAVRWHTPQKYGSVNVFQARAVDTTAAGDAFVGGFLTCLAEQNVRSTGLATFSASDALRAALRFAAACGAVAVTRHGAFAAMPTRADVANFLEVSA
jgi:fructokinase